MGKRTITVAAVVAAAIAAVQSTPMAFLPKDATDFVLGLAIGLGIGAVVTWIAVGFGDASQAPGPR